MMTGVNHPLQPIAGFEHARSISTGSCHNADLLISFSAELLRAVASGRLVAKPETEALLGNAIKIGQRYHEYEVLEAHTIDRTMEALWSLLEDLAPEGYYFGTHPDDGADYGYWPSVWTTGGPDA